MTRYLELRTLVRNNSSGQIGTVVGIRHNPDSYLVETKDDKLVVWDIGQVSRAAQDSYKDESTPRLI